MQFCKLNRADFASLINEAAVGGSRPPRLHVGQPDCVPESHSLWACWNEESPREDWLRTLIVVGDQDLTDFLAWAVTFLPAFRPLTAFARVLPWAVFSLVQERQQASPSDLNGVLIGGILGETMTSATGRGFIESLPLTAYESTYSYAVSRTLLMGFSQKILQYVSDGWQDARQFTEQPARTMPPEDLES